MNKILILSLFAFFSFATFARDLSMAQELSEAIVKNGGKGSWILLNDKKLSYSNKNKDIVLDFELHSFVRWRGALQGQHNRWQLSLIGIYKEDNWGYVYFKVNMVLSAGAERTLLKIIRDIRAERERKKMQEKDVAIKKAISSLAPE